MSSVESRKLLLSSFSEYSEKFELLRRLPPGGIPSVDQRLVRRRFNVAVGSSPVTFEGLPAGDILLAGFGDEDLSVLMML